MNNYENDYLDDLALAEQEFNIDSRVIKQIERESKKKKIDCKKKKIKVEEKE